jgi:hypothetical protein
MTHGIFTLLLILAIICGCAPHEPIKPPAKIDNEELRGYKPQVEEKSEKTGKPKTEKPEKPETQSETPKRPTKYGGQTIRAKESPE